MIIRKSSNLHYSDVTPRDIYMNRRRFLAAGSAALGALAVPFSLAADNKLPNLVKSPFSTTEKQTPLEIVTHFNNYYEFGTGKEIPPRTRPNLRRARGPCRSKARSPSPRRWISTRS